MKDRVLSRVYFNGTLNIRGYICREWSADHEDAIYLEPSGVVAIVSRATGAAVYLSPSTWATVSGQELDTKTVDSSAPGPGSVAQSAPTGPSPKPTKPKLVK